MQIVSLRRVSQGLIIAADMSGDDSDCPAVTATI